MYEFLRSLSLAVISIVTQGQSKQIKSSYKMYLLWMVIIILNGSESKGEQRVEQVLKERLAHRLILGGREYGPLLESTS